MDKQKKLVHALSLPYPEPHWPHVSADHEQAILTLLIPLLQPIGNFRRDNVARSRGKGRAGNPKNNTRAEAMPEWMPEIYDRLTIGFNSTVRRLESLARSRKPAILSQAVGIEQPPHAVPDLSVVFVCRQALPNIMTSSMPLLLATSSPKTSRARLVELSTQSEAKLAQALNQPRLGVLGLEQDAAEFNTLVQFLEENIEAVEVIWLEHAASTPYLPVNVKTVETSPKPKLDSTTTVQKRKRTDAG
ncbi:RNase P and RNase MRP subunit [Exophiala sideris]|uniref:RNase P and RNase MRP subunit n=1 Tax=Exophiala sideris TaxID=1016849 RepID=A0ABR0J305_9EURO|nr:RNase P and RNase MRP subunit [Exophiala sideris]KAK5033651.1 RNase P and RNase MRP subunit [Exophiala sideris]KAK5055474.1 RNase P and RNase MRP subunit [Exophiala sideris]KAK5176440.1 RNase P and RNase MRP subunit [Eurotiomycetes sp. CCFEE 6388]